MMLRSSKVARRGWWATHASRRMTKRRRCRPDALARAAVEVVFEEEASGANTASVNRIVAIF
jgi:hypothetical protein